jgi:hypothetical protein
MLQRDMLVIPAQAEIQAFIAAEDWIAAFAGMTQE